MAHSRLKCPKCELDFGQESRFLDHLTDVHACLDHEGLYVQEVLSNKKPCCGCGCNETPRWAGWKKGYISKYIRGHNAAIDSVYFNPDKQKEFADKRIKGFAEGKYSSWNKGLTKDTSEKIATMSAKIATSLNEGYANGTIVDWRIIDKEKAKNAAAMSSVTKKRKFAAGELTIWNKGETKETNSIVAQAAEKISKRYDLPNAGNRIKLDDLQKRIQAHSSKFELLSSLSEYKTRRIERLKFRCIQCNSIQIKSLAMLEETPVCFKCHPKESKGQLEIYEFVKSLSPDAILSDRNAISPKELDIYVPSKKFGIEYDGLYWHSELFLDENYAINKSNAVLEKDITLLRVFEDEWKNKRPLIESMIKHRLGLVNKVIGARKCVIAELTTKERKEFMDRCHIDGDTRSKIAFGLFYEGILVSAISLRKPFHKKYSDVMEVARFCSDPEVSVPGALSRLSKHTIDWAKYFGFRALMTYVDRRIGNAKGYQFAKFDVIRETKARFWWTDFVNRYDRFSFKADSKNSLTQQQVADAAGVVKIWGCSNIILELS